MPRYISTKFMAHRPHLPTGMPRLPCQIPADMLCRGSGGGITADESLLGPCTGSAPSMLPLGSGVMGAGTATQTPLPTPAVEGREVVGELTLLARSVEAYPAAPPPPRASASSLLRAAEARAVQRLTAHPLTQTVQPLINGTQAWQLHATLPSEDTACLPLRPNPAASPPHARPRSSCQPRPAPRSARSRTAQPTHLSSGTICANL